MDIKGIKEGILITLETQDWQDARKKVIEKVKEKQDFFQGAKLVLDVGNVILSVGEVQEFQKELSQSGIDLYGLVSKSIVTKETAHKLGLITKLEKLLSKPDQKLKPLDINLPGETAILIQKTMRSGFKVAYQGHVIVIGDVNPGAEIIASGSVVVWGRLRGTVHAGADGDQSAVVCALDLSPMQLRIATKITTTPQDQADPKPEIASIFEGDIIAEPWQH